MERLKAFTLRDLVAMFIRFGGDILLGGVIFVIAPALFALRRRF